MEASGELSARRIGTIPHEEAPLCTLSFAKALRALACLWWCRPREMWNCMVDGCGQRSEGEHARRSRGLSKHKDSTIGRRGAQGFAGHAGGAVWQGMLL